jgi:hypothetical protein
MVKNELRNTSNKEDIIIRPDFANLAIYSIITMFAGSLFALIACGKYAYGDAGCFWNHTNKRYFTFYDDRIANDVCQSSFAPLAQVPAFSRIVAVGCDQRGVQESPPIPHRADQ